MPAAHLRPKLDRGDWMCDEYRYGFMFFYAYRAVLGLVQGIGHSKVGVVVGIDGYALIGQTCLII